MKESVMSLNLKNPRTIGFPTFKVTKVLTIFYDWPIKYYFWRFRYMIS